MKPTTEQQDIINEAKLGTNLAIQAFAGAAKTSTCIMIANELTKPSLYIAFNKSIADEAKEKFPINVECRTLHSIAWKEIVKYGNSPMGKKLKGYFNTNDIELPESLKPETDFLYRQQIVQVITEFCQSDQIDIEFFALLHDEVSHLSNYIVKYWNKLIDPIDPSFITHDLYLKLYQLTNPKLDFDVIYLDECQDSNPVTLDIVLNQTHAQLIIVGDPYQAIYEWRGAINAFDIIPKAFKIMYLTESFRFTQEIADKANNLLKYANCEKKIIGHNTISPITCEPTIAVIVRNNSTLINELLQASTANKKVNCLADLSKVWPKLYHIQSLYFKEKPKFPDTELSQYKTYADLLKAAEKQMELAKLVKLTATLAFGEGLYKNIDKIKTTIATKDKDFDFTLTTAHKAKGLEWDEVYLADDLFYVKEDEDKIEKLFENQTLNLLYVAITRAKYIVHLPLQIKNLIEEI